MLAPYHVRQVQAPPTRSIWLRRELVLTLRLLFSGIVYFILRYVTILSSFVDDKIWRPVTAFFYGGESIA